jgi:hypothetical protein
LTRRPRAGIAKRCDVNNPNSANAPDRAARLDERLSAIVRFCPDAQ